jgi:predicted nucleotidyltransferase
MTTDLTADEDPVTRWIFYNQVNEMVKVGVRELARETSLDTKTVMKRLAGLCGRKLVKRHTRQRHFPYYTATLSPLYFWEKSQMLQRRIIRSGLIDFLEKRLKPRAIVLFGSMRTGSYNHESDVDLFILGKPEKIDLWPFERRIGHEIQLLFDDDFANLSWGLGQNIVNGIVLSGTLWTEPMPDIPEWPVSKKES